MQLPIFLQATADVISPRIVILSRTSGQLVGCRTKQLFSPEWMLDDFLQFPYPSTDILSLQLQDGAI